MNRPRRWTWSSGVRLARDLVMVLIGTGIIAMALASMLSRIGNVVLVLVLAIVVEIVLSPMVDKLAQYWNRAWAVFVVVFLAVVLVVFGGGLLIAILARQVVGLASRLPVDFTQLSMWTPGVLGWLNHLGINISLTQIEDRILTSVGNLSSIFITQTVNVVTHLVDTVINGAVTLFVIVYLLLDAERIHSAIIRLVPQDRRENLLAVEHTLSRVVGGYVRGQILLSLIVGGGFAIGSWGIGLPYPVVIGLVAAVMEMIPLIGPILGAIVPIGLAIFGGHIWSRVPEVLALVALIHLLESQVLGPRIIRSQVGLHPVLSVVALMIGADLKGVWGALFAVPAAGILVAAWIAGVRVWREKVVLPKEPGVFPTQSQQSRIRGPD